MFALFFLFSLANAVVYYVEPNGSGLCGIYDPCAYGSLPSGGDTIVFLSGTYSSLSINKNGYDIETRPDARFINCAFTILNGNFTANSTTFITSIILSNLAPKVQIYSSIFDSSTFMSLVSDDSQIIGTNFTNMNGNDKIQISGENVVFNDNTLYKPATTSTPITIITSYGEATNFTCNNFEIVNPMTINDNPVVLILSAYGRSMDAYIHNITVTNPIVDGALIEARIVPTSDDDSFGNTVELSLLTIRGGKINDGIFFANNLDNNGILRIYPSFVTATKVDWNNNPAFKIHSTGSLTILNAYANEAISICDSITEYSTLAECSGTKILLAISGYTDGIITAPTCTSTIIDMIENCFMQ
jgi:hypothetical protein